MRAPVRALALALAASTALAARAPDGSVATANAAPSASTPVAPAASTAATAAAPAAPTSPASTTPPGSRPAARAARRSGPAPIVFFWSSPGQADADARPALLAAIDAAAAPRGARVLDLSPRPAAPPDTAARVARAVAAYDGMRFGEAIGELDVAAAAVAEHGAAGLGRDALVDLYLYRALSKIEAGDEAGAWNDFVRAATIDPARILDPARFRPTAVKSFTRAVKEVSARAPITLAIEAPVGSRIHLDGRPIGRDRAREILQPGEHYIAVERPAAPAFARAITLAGAVTLVVPDDAARAPSEADLRRRALRLGAAAALVVALSRQDGVPVVELRSLERGGAALRGAVRLGPSPAADARDLRQAVDRALGELDDAGASRADLAGSGPSAPPPRWYKNRWLWLAIGAAGALVAVSPFLLDSGGPSSVEATLPTGALDP